MSPTKQLKNVACGILAAWAVTTASPVVAASQVLNTFVSFFKVLSFTFLYFLSNLRDIKFIITAFSVFGKW